jgi:hypothetical protein
MCVQRYRRAHHAKLDSLVIGEDQQVLPAVGASTMFDGVPDPRPATSCREWPCFGVGGIDHPALRRRVAVAADDHGVTGARPPHGEFKSLVRFGNENLVRYWVGAETVPLHLVWTVRLVMHHVEEARRVGGPGSAVVAPGNVVGEVQPGPQITESKPEDLVPGIVDGVRDQRLVWTHQGDPQIEVRSIARQLDDIENNLGRGMFMASPDESWVIATRGELGEVRILWSAPGSGYLVSGKSGGHLG